MKRICAVNLLITLALLDMVMQLPHGPMVNGREYILSP